MKSLINGRIVFAVLTVACLTTVLLTVAPIRSGSPGPGKYDPWLDWNDDSKIDIKDVSRVARAFGTNGQNVSRASIEYESNWIDITDKCGQNSVITHGLNSTDLIGDIQGKTTLSSGSHQRNYGLTGYMQGWNKTYGATGEDGAYDLVQTVDGGYALVGWTNSFGAGFDDFWLVKTDAAGTMQWNKTYGGTNDDMAHALVQTADGGYALVGYTSSFGAGNRDFWLVKTDAAGNAQWNRTYGGTSYDEAYALVRTSDGGYALAGETQSFGAGGVDAWLVKTDASGNMQWNRTYGGTSADYASALVQTGDGGYALAGGTDSSGWLDFWLVKTGAAGNMQWSETYGGASHDYALALEQTGDGGYALAGYTHSFGAGGGDSWLVKTDASGTEQWDQTYGGTYDDDARALVQTVDGGYALVGWTNSFGAGLDDFWLIKTDTNGNPEWNQTYGGTSADYASALVQTGDGGYALAGRTGALGATMSGGDFWLVKTGANGSDRARPTTVDDYDGEWRNADFTITLTAADYESGVAETYYRINDGPVKAVSTDGQPLITTEGANNTLEYWSVDNAGNEELPHKIVTGIKLDKVSAQKETTIQSQLFSYQITVPGREIRSPNIVLAAGTQVRIRFEASGSLSFFCQDSNEYSMSASHGWSMIWYEWDDETANMDRTYTIPATDTWYFTLVNYGYSGIAVYNITLYEFTTYKIKIARDKAYYHSGEQVALNASATKNDEAISGLNVTIRVLDPLGSTIFTQTSETDIYGQVLANFTLLGEEGTYNATAYTDIEGTAIEVSTSLAIDDTPPLLNIILPENGTWFPSYGSLIFNTNELLSWMAYSLDNIANVTITGNATLSGLLSGEHTIVLYATDIAGNTGHSTKTFFNVDTTSPSTLHDYDDMWHSSDFTIPLTAADYESGVAETYYRINGGPVKAVSTDGQPLITTEGANNTLEYWSVDNASNEELPHKIVTGIKLDKTSPTGSLTINSNAPYTNSTSVTLTLTATDATSDIAEMRFSNDNITYTDWQVYTASKLWNLQDADGAKTVYVQFRDHAGLFSPAYLDTIVLDTTTPNIGIPSREPTDDIFPAQPVKISINVTDATSQVKSATLYYSLNNGTTWEEPIPLNLNASTGLYEATIPPQLAETWVRFEIAAHDYAGNNATLDRTEPYCVYQVIPEFLSSPILPLLIIATSIAMILLKKKRKMLT